MFLFMIHYVRVPTFIKKNNNNTLMDSYITSGHGIAILDIDIKT